MSDQTKPKAKEEAVESSKEPEVQEMAESTSRINQFTEMNDMVVTATGYQALP